MYVKQENIQNIVTPTNTKYQKKNSRLPPLGAIFLSAPPLTWNPGSVPDYSDHPKKLFYPCFAGCSTTRNFINFIVI